MDVREMMVEQIAEQIAQVSRTCGAGAPPYRFSAVFAEGALAALRTVDESINHHAKISQAMLGASDELAESAVNAVRKFCTELASALIVTAGVAWAEQQKTGGEDG